MKKIYSKYKEILDYLIWGIAAWLLYMILIWVFTEQLRWNATVSTIIDNIIVIHFAYLTNKFFVFRSKANSFAELKKEYISFITARLGTMVLSAVIIFVFCDCLKYNSESFRIARWAVEKVLHIKSEKNVIAVLLYKFSDGMIWQLITQFIVIVANYILSKLWIFRKKKPVDEGVEGEKETE